MGGKQSIIDAAGKGDLNRVQECLRVRGKAALHDRSAGGWTALHKAARCGKEDMVAKLLEFGAVLPRSHNPPHAPSPLPPTKPSSACRTL